MGIPLPSFSYSIMSRYIYCLIFIGLTEILFSQKHDYQWYFGYISYPQGIAQSNFDFNKDSLYSDYIYGKIKPDKSNVTYSDSSGNLLLIANGCIIVDKNQDTIQNGSGLNPGWQATNFCPDGEYNVVQWGFILPFPKNEHTQAVLIHFRNNDTNDALLYTVIDLTANAGKPAVTDQKNIIFTEDILGVGCLAAVKHANGRDWWIITKKKLANKYYISLLDPTGVHFNHVQEIGDGPVKPNWYEMVFTPDGSKLAVSNPVENTILFDFDRCTGQLSNPNRVEFYDIADSLTNYTNGGLAFSVDNHYMYSTNRVYLYQYDMLSNDIGASRKVVADYDGFGGVWPTWFSFMELAPDGRIFSRPPCGGCKGMHVMWHPEREGELSDFRQHYFYDDSTRYSGMPMMPNYRLGALDGSPCDTIGFDNHPLAGYRYDRLTGLYVDFTSVSWYEPETWYWDFGDPASGAANTSTEMHPDHIYSTSGYYSVCLTVCNQYSCDTICKWVYVSESVDTEEPGFPLSLGVVNVFPNPVGDVGLVSWEFPKSVSGRLVLFNSSGTSLAIKELEVVDRAEMNVARLPSGVYFWMFTGVDGVRWSGKLVK
jgi:PKD domain